MPVVLSQVATVKTGQGIRTGSASENGREVVVGVAVMRIRENSRTVATAVAERLKVIGRSLPTDIVVKPVLDRTVLVNSTISTVAKNLAEGAVLVVEFTAIHEDMFGSDNLIARIETHILGIEPAVSRTLELPFSLTLAQIHAVLQAAFGWTDNHLHRFEIGGFDYGPLDLEEDDSNRRTFDSSSVRLHDFALRYGRPVEFLYEYDFGDSWVHVLTLNAVQRDPAARYSRCTGGSRGGPPEDSGGAPGYAEFLEAWSDP